MEKASRDAVTWLGRKLQDISAKDVFGAPVNAALSERLEFLGRLKQHLNSAAAAGATPDYTAFWDEVAKVRPGAHGNDPSAFMKALVDTYNADQANLRALRGKVYGLVGDTATVSGAAGLALGGAKGVAKMYRARKALKRDAPEEEKSAQTAPAAPAAPAATASNPGNYSAYSHFVWPSLALAAILPFVATHQKADKVSDDMRKAYLARRKQRAQQEFGDLLADDFNKQSSLARRIDAAVDELNSMEKSALESGKLSNAATLLLGLILAGGGSIGYMLGARDRDSSKKLDTLEALSKKRVAENRPLLQLDTSAKRTQILTGPRPVLRVPFKAPARKTEEASVGVPAEFSPEKMAKRTVDLGVWGGLDIPFLSPAPGQDTRGIVSRTLGDAMAENAPLAGEKLYTGMRDAFVRDLKKIPGKAIGLAQQGLSKLPGLAMRAGGYMQQFPGLAAGLWNRINQAAQPTPPTQPAKTPIFDDLRSYAPYIGMNAGLKPDELPVGSTPLDYVRNHLLPPAMTDLATNPDVTVPNG